VKAILVVEFFVVDSGTVVRAAVDAGPGLATDVAEGVAAVASVVIVLASSHISMRLNGRDKRYVVAGFCQFDRGAAHSALLVALLCGRLLELGFVLVLFADVILCAVLKKSSTVSARHLST
jgi:hypothetical protein